MSFGMRRRVKWQCRTVRYVNFFVKDELSTVCTKEMVTHTCTTI